MLIRKNLRTKFNNFNQMSHSSITEAFVISKLFPFFLFGV